MRQSENSNRSETQIGVQLWKNWMMCTSSGLGEVLEQI